MTNAKKFKEVFGIAPDIEVMMLECPPRGEECQWRDGDACHCDDWWIAEYKEPTEKKITEEDILELKHRFGDEVEFVVRDMISGEGKRWDGVMEN